MMKKNLLDLDPRVTHALSLAPVEWSAWLERQLAKQPNCSALQMIERELTRLAEHASALAEYISCRYSSGCGDAGHESAVKAVNRRRIKVRKAIGYTYPKSGVFNF